MSKLLLTLERAIEIVKETPTAVANIDPCGTMRSRALMFQLGQSELRKEIIKRLKDG